MAKLEPFIPSENLSALTALQQEADRGKIEVVKKTKQYIVVLIGKEQIAIAINSIKEILEVPIITPLPNVPTYILGICSVRGDITSVTDVKLMLDITGGENKTRKEIQKQRVIILEGDKYMTGIVVDTVVEVLDFADEEIEASKNTLTGRLGDFCVGLYKEGGRMLIVMDVNALLNSNELSQFN